MDLGFSSVRLDDASLDFRCRGFRHDVQLKRWPDGCRANGFDREAAVQEGEKIAAGPRTGIQVMVELAFERIGLRACFENALM